MPLCDQVKRKATPGETPSPVDYKKTNMCDSGDEETLSPSGLLFTQNSMEAISVDGKSDRELLELICNRVNSISMDLPQVNAKQDRILQRIKQVETRVNKHEERINDLTEKQSRVEGKIDRYPNLQEIHFAPDVTIVAINMPRFANEDDTRLARRLLAAMGCGNKRIVRVMRTPVRDNNKGVFKIELDNKDDKIDILRRKASLKQTSEFRNVFLRSALSHTERLAQLNFKTILSEMPLGKELRITNNGRIIKRSPDQHSALQKQSPVTNRSHQVYQSPRDMSVKTAALQSRSPYNTRTSPGAISYSAALQGATGNSQTMQPTSQVLKTNTYKEPFQPQPLLVHQYTPQSQGIPTQMLLSSQSFQPPDQTEPFIASGTPNMQRHSQQTTQTAIQNNHSQPMLVSTDMINNEGQNFWTPQNQGDYSVNHC